MSSQNNKGNSKKSKGGSNGRVQGWPSERTPDVIDLKDANREQIMELLESDHVSFDESGGTHQLKVEPVGISLNVYAWIRGLLNRIQQIEFSAMLDIHDDGIVKDIYFPDQVGMSSTYEIKDHDSCEGYDGFLHSHPWSANPTFSGTDKNGHVTNYKLSVLVGRDPDSALGIGTNAFRRISIDGALVRCPTNVKILSAIDTPYTFSTDALEEILDERYERRVGTGWSRKNSRGKSRGGRSRRGGSRAKGTRRTGRGRQYRRSSKGNGGRGQNGQELPRRTGVGRPQRRLPGLGKELPGAPNEPLHKDMDYDGEQNDLSTPPF